jgi:hypothetical protein
VDSGIRDTGHGIGLDRFLICRNRCDSGDHCIDPLKSASFVLVVSVDNILVCPRVLSAQLFCDISVSG